MVGGGRTWIPVVDPVPRLIGRWRIVVAIALDRRRSARAATSIVVRELSPFFRQSGMFATA